MDQNRIGCPPWLMHQGGDEVQEEDEKKIEDLAEADDEAVVSF